MKKIFLASLALLFIATGANAWWQSIQQVAVSGGTVVVCGSGWTGPTSGLTNCWPMDNAHVSGTTILDAVGSINGTAGATVTAGTGPSGLANSARIYDGTNQPVLLLADPLLGNTAWSVSTWINLVNYSSNDGGDQRWVCFFPVSGSARVMFANASNGGGIDAYTNLEFQSTSALVTTATWHNIIVTWDGVTQITYLNGTSLTMSSGAGDVCDDGTWVLGGRSASARLWAGGQGTTAVWNRALSGAEALAVTGAF